MIAPHGTDHRGDAHNHAVGILQDQRIARIVAIDPPGKAFLRQCQLIARHALAFGRAGEAWPGQRRKRQQSI